MSSPDNSYEWAGRADLEDGPDGRRWHQIACKNHATNGIGLVGFASDLGVIANKGRAGANKGPNAIRNALANFAWHLECDLRDYGNLVPKESLSKTQNHYAECITQSLSEQQFTFGLGGGHEIALGTFMGLEGAFGKDKRIGIINFDAHFDLRIPAPHESSGTPFWQIAEYCNSQQRPFNYSCLGIAESANTRALFKRAQALDVNYLLDRDCDFPAAEKILAPMLGNIDELYVTVCLDAFEASQAPGVSAPSSLGINLSFVIRILEWLAHQQKTFGYQWRLMDIAELNPALDIDNRTARLAARLIFDVCGMITQPQPE